MPWKYNNTVIKTGRSWVDSNGIQHPRNWMIWSESDKTAAGLVWENDPAPFDARFWWDANLPKALDDVNEVDEDGNPVIDPITNQQIVTLGLKSKWKNIIKEQALGLLAPTDWMVIKASEVANYTVPADITTYRAAVRTASNTIEANIDGAADHTAFVALFDAPTDDDGNPTGNAPINNWPDEI
mgnify:CR=1 FL=1